MGENKPSSSGNQILDDLLPLVHEICTMWSDPLLSTAAATAKTADIQSAVKKFFLEDFQRALRVSSEAAREHLRMASEALELWEIVEGERLARKDLEEGPFKKIAELIVSIEPELQGIIETLRTSRQELYKVIGDIGDRPQKKRFAWLFDKKHPLEKMKGFLDNQEKVLTWHINWWEPQTTEWLAYQRTRQGLLESKLDAFPRQRLFANFERLEHKHRLYSSCVATLLDKYPALSRSTRDLVDAQDVKDLEELQSLQIYLEGACRLYGEWCGISPKLIDWYKDLKECVYTIFRDDLRGIVNTSLQIAKCGRVVGMDAINIDDALPQEAFRLSLQTFTASTKKIAQKAKDDGHEMISNLRATRQRISSAIAWIDHALREMSRSPLNEPIKELRGLKNSLLEIKDQPSKQEQFATVLIDWWQRVEDNLSQMEQSVEALVAGDVVRKKASRKHWEELSSKYDKYISSMIQLQDRFPFLKQDDSM